MHKIIKSYLRRIGSSGGKVKSVAKATAARQNGALGGRPKTKQGKEHVVNKQDRVK